MANQSMSYAPKRAVFETTLACNLRCKHCGSRAGKPRSDELSTGECLDLFRQLADLGCERITISGGEPLMRSDWPELIGGAVLTGMRVGMITNAVSLDDDAVQVAKSKGLQAIGFSVDGPDAATHDHIRGRAGHYAHLMRAMESCRRHGLAFSVVTFLHRDNYTRLPEMYDFIRDQGAFAWQVQLGTDMGNLSDHPELLIRPLDLPRIQKILAALVRKQDGLRIHVSDSIGYYGAHEVLLRSSAAGGNVRTAFGGCPAGRRVIGIESNGNIKGCLSIMAGYNDQGRDFVEGNIRERPLAEIWNDPDAFSYNRQWKIEDLGGFCRECRHAARCKGGCRAKMTASGGGVENPMCIYRVEAEQGLAGRRAGQAAAVLLASALGASAQGCNETAQEDHVVDAGTADAGDVDAGDTGSETEDTATTPDYSDPGPGTDVTDYGVPEYSDPDPGTDTWTDVEEYGIPDPGTDTEVTPDYGIPDTETGSETAVVEYGIPDTETATDTLTDVAAYGMPDTGTATDTETDVTDYGVPEYGIPDTDTTN